MRVMGRATLILIATGFLLGTGARLVMAVIAALQGMGPRFSVGGTLEVVAMGLIVGVPGALVFILTRFRLRRFGRSLGPLWGALLFLGLLLFPPPSARSAAAAASAGVRIVGLGLFGLLFIAWGMIVQAAADRFLNSAR